MTQSAPWLHISRARALATCLRRRKQSWTLFKQVLLVPWGLKEHITFPMESLHPEAQGTYFIQATGYHHTDKAALYKEAGLTESFDSSKMDLSSCQL